MGLCLLGAIAFAQEPTDGSKWVSYTEIGSLVGNADDDYSSPFIFHSSLSYSFHKRLSAGVGLGFDFFELTYMPVTANVMYRLTSRLPVAPFLRLQAGYQVPLERTTRIPEEYVYEPSAFAYIYRPTIYQKVDTQGGFMANPSLGAIIYMKSGVGIAVSAGYRYQQLNYKGAEDFEVHREYSRLSLTLGIIF